jgi:nucleotide-binding universal stress UspA family protein
MTYRTLIAPWDGTDAALPSIAWAAGLARVWGAHLVALAMAARPAPVAMAFGGPDPVLVMRDIEETTIRIREMADRLDGVRRQGPDPFEIRTCSAFRQDIGLEVAQHARYADLVIVPQPYAEPVLSDMARAAEGALFDGHCPVLVIPRAMPPGLGRGPALIAWDESPEALAAVRLAIPLLGQMTAVEILCVDDGHGAQADGGEAGAALATMLARHDLSVSVTGLARFGQATGEVITTAARERGAALLVTGAYGHSRFREALLGGTTRTLLAAAPVPVFMAR